MAEREVKVGLATFLRADAPVWGFGLQGETVDVDEADIERFDRLNESFAAPVVPLPEVSPVNEPVEPLSDAPAQKRSARKSSK